MRFACLIPFVSAALFAQVSPADSAEVQTVRELLASTDAARLAWGAQLAARYGQQEFVPDIRRLLSSKHEWAQANALDALIRLKAKVPPEELIPLLPRFTDAVIILAVANGHRDLLFSMLGALKKDDPLNGAVWVALHESLQNGEPGNYWSMLLREWTIHVVVFVTDTAQPGLLGAVSGGGFGGGCYDCDGAGKFPPYVSYSLTLWPEPGDVVLNTKPHLVYYRRRLDHSTANASFIDRDDYRSDFVAAAISPMTSKVQGHMSFDIVWRTDQAYSEEMKKIREKTLAGFREMLGWMIRKTLLAPEDAALGPRIELRIEDQRSDKAHALPPTPPWE
jgi:hypothetical protein